MPVLILHRKQKMIHMNFKEKLSPSAQRKISDILFILYAGGAALLSYSLVYALRKPFTAATFDGMELFGMDYKIATSIKSRPVLFRYLAIWYLNS